MSLKQPSKFLSLLAPAKLNLTLRIIGRLSDKHRLGGYHLLETVIAPLTLADEVVVTISGIKGITCTSQFSGELEVHLQHSYSKAQREILTYELNSTKNLAYRAAEVFLRDAGLLEETGVTIALTKHIPIGAGLGGGSADAAAVLVALNKLCELDYPETKLYELGATLGSDVPACIARRLIFASGTGTSLSDFDLEFCDSCAKWLDTLGLIVIKPTISISTARAYQALNLKAQLYDEIPKIAESFFAKNCNCNDFSAILTILNQGATSHGLAALPRKAASADLFDNFVACLGNDFEDTIFSRYKEVGQARDVLLENGCLKTLLAGSGSAVVGFTENSSKAHAVTKQVRSVVPKGWFVHATKF